MLVLTDGFYRSLRDCKSSHLSRTLLCILVNLSSALVCTISILHRISTPLAPFLASSKGSNYDLSIDLNFVLQTT